jgi:hypothetical protein
MQHLAMMLMSFDSTRHCAPVNHCLKLLALALTVHCCCCTAVVAAAVAAAAAAVAAVLVQC